MGPVMGNLGQVSYSLTAAVGGILCVLRGFDIGGLTVFVNYSRQFSRPINEVAMQVNTIFSALAGAERVFAVMDADTEKEDAPNAIRIEENSGFRSAFFWVNCAKFRGKRRLVRAKSQILSDFFLVTHFLLCYNECWLCVFPHAGSCLSGGAGRYHTP